MHSKSVQKQQKKGAREKEPAQGFWNQHPGGREGKRHGRNRKERDGIGVGQVFSVVASVIVKAIGKKVVLSGGRRKKAERKKTCPFEDRRT